MSAVSVFQNAFQRRVEAMFPRYFGGSTKHSHYKDFGWPEQLEFNDFYHMWKRNSVAKAGINRTIIKVWETNPDIWETEKSGATELEKEIRDRFSDLRVWNKLAEADRRSMVGGYSAVILRLADSKSFDQPVTTVPGGLFGLVGLIPVWKPQLRVGAYDERPDSPTYGEVLYYEFVESKLPGKSSTAKNTRVVRVHPDRVIIWSEDGTMDGSSVLEAGYNDLLDIEKIKGAGGEGFWKNSRGAPIIEAPEGVRPADVAKQMNVDIKDLLDEINEQVDSFQRGFDKGLMLGGMTAKPLTVTLPNPEQFFTAPVQSFAASLNIPLKVLLGSQTGERSSTEDAKEWNRTAMSIRTDKVLPLLREFLNRLEQFGILPERDWIIHWESLTEATPEEKMSRAEKMANICKNLPNQPPFSWEEIRETAGFDPDVEPPDTDISWPENGPEDRDVEDMNK